MPGAPRFTQKPTIQQTPTGDLLMECLLEADPPPTIAWQHSGVLLPPSSRCIQTLVPQEGILYRASLVIKEPNADDGGAYRCNAKNQLGETNANINLNFAGAGDDTASKSRGPSFVGRPRIIPKDGGALIVMECTVKSSTPPVARWMKDGVPLVMGGLYHDIFTDLGDHNYLCQLEIRGPSASDAGQYKCNIKNDQGETNANLALNFEEPEAAPEEKKRPSSRTRRSRSKSRAKDSASPRPPSRGPGKEDDSRPPSPKKQLKSREGTPSKKTKEGSPRKSIRSRTATPTQDMLSPEDAADRPPRHSKTDQIDADQITAKRKSDKETLPPPGEKRQRQASPKPAAARSSPAPGRESSTPREARNGSAAPTEEKISQQETAQLGVKDSQRKRSTTPLRTTVTMTAANEKYKRAPLVMEPASSKIGKTGETVSLEVEWQCHSSTKITWWKDGTVLQMSREYSSSFDGRLARLTIHSLTDEHCGLFKCHATSDYGESQSSAMVKCEQQDVEEGIAMRKQSRQFMDEEFKKAATKSALKAAQDTEDEKSASLMAPPEKLRKRSKSKSPAPPSKKEEESQAEKPIKKSTSFKNQEDDVS